ncbi:MAG: S8 family serine peptidase [Woeseia sp.]|nr:S8 family serine peptidase [Woeseia sp.]
MNPRYTRLKASMIKAGLAASLVAVSLCNLSVTQAATSVASAMSQTAPVIGKQAIVKFDKSIAGDTARMNAVLADVANSVGFEISHLRTLAIGAEVLRVGSPAEVNALVATLSARADVVYAEADTIMQVSATPNDTRYNEQWHYFESTGGLRANQAWDTTTGNGTVVAVIDTGYRPHVDLDSKILPGYDFIGDLNVANDGNGRDSDAQDPGDWTTAGECGVGSPASNSSWHGTHVAGTIAAESNNGQGVAGVAWGADILPIRVLGTCGGYTSDIADGIVWAAGGSVSGVPANSNPADVLNLSLGGGGSCASTSQNAINTARSLGATVVVAAGNSNANAANYNPASCSGVVTVAATDRDGNRAYYSNYGAVVDVAAPGGETAVSSNGVLSTLNSGTTTPASDNYAFYQGTSMATPHVAGVAALLYAVNPSITPDLVETTLKNTARAFPGSCSQCGSGLVDANAVVLDGGTGGGGGGGPVELTNGTAETGLSGGSGAQLFFTLEVPAGEATLDFAMSGGSGDADLYVKFGSAPTTGSYDCRPYLNGNNESCDFSNPAAGTWHVMINGYSSFSGVSLTGTHAGGGGGGSCPSGYTEYTGSLASTGSEAFEPDGTYYYTGSSGTHAGILSGTGPDFDLYLRKWNGNGWSNVSSSTSSSSDESISYSGTSGYYTWRVYSYSGSGDYSLCLSTP